MPRIGNNPASFLSITREDRDRTEVRVLWVMTATVAVAVLISVALAPWRVSAGLFLGGGLSLLNYHWLRSSVAAILNLDSGKPHHQSSRYILRYLVLGIAVFAAYELRLVSLTAAIVGLCAFVPAFFVEAGRQFYYSIIRREESF